MPENYQGIAFLVSGALLLLVFGLVSNHRTAKARKFLEALPWEIKKEGVFEEVQYGEQDHVRRERRGAMVHSTHEVHYKTYHTFLYFADGSSFVLKGLHSIEFSKGTKIQILTKGGDYKYDVVKA
jgi:hypothetical protein